MGVHPLGTVDRGSERASGIVNPPHLLTPREVGEKLLFDEATIRRQLNAGTFPFPAPSRSRLSGSARSGASRRRPSTRSSFIAGEPTRAAS